MTLRLVFITQTPQSFAFASLRRGGQMQYTKKEKAIKDDGDEHELEPEEGKNTAMIQILIHDNIPIIYQGQTMMHIFKLYRAVLFRYSFFLT